MERRFGSSPAAVCRWRGCAGCMPGISTPVQLSDLPCLIQAPHFVGVRGLGQRAHGSLRSVGSVLDPGPPNSRLVYFPPHQLQDEKTCLSFSVLLGRGHLEIWENGVCK